MAAAVFRKVDLNRFAKAYPFLRKEPRDAYRSSIPVSLESAVVYFNGSDEVTYNFSNSYSAPPVVVATSQNDSFNVFIKVLTSTNVTIGASVVNNDSVSIIVVSE